MCKLLKSPFLHSGVDDCASTRVCRRNTSFLSSHMAVWLRTNGKDSHPPASICLKQLTRSCAHMVDSATPHLRAYLAQARRQALTCGWIYFRPSLPPSCLGVHESQLTLGCFDHVWNFCGQVCVQKEGHHRCRYITRLPIAHHQLIAEIEKHHHPSIDLDHTPSLFSRFNLLPFLTFLPFILSFLLFPPLLQKKLFMFAPF